MKYMERQILEITEPFVSPEERTRLLHYCMKVVKDKDVAEDLVQETLLEAWKHLHTLRDPSRRTQWLSGVARNVCLRWRRKFSQDTAHLVDLSNLSTRRDIPPLQLEELLTYESDIEVELERKELIELLDRAMALLPPDTRTVLVKRYVEESPLQEVASELGVNISTAAMRLQRGKLALRRVLTTDLSQETALYTPQTFAPSSEQWETTPLWCYLCGQHHLLGIRNPDEGKLYLKCPDCNRNSGEVLSYSELPLLKGIKGYRPLLNRLRNWCAQRYWIGLCDGSLPCDGCGRMLPVRICRAEDLPEWIRRKDIEAGWAYPYPDRLVAIFCEPCRASYRSVLEDLVLDLLEGRQFLQEYTRIRTLPSQQVEAEGRPALVTRHESVTNNATLTVVADSETYKILRIERSDR